MARCLDVILAVAESFDCSLIHLNHTVLSPSDDYAGSYDEGSAGGGVLSTDKKKPTVHEHRGRDVSAGFTHFFL